ncbi:hypothetical protein AB0L30_00450 [Microbispora rosea]
MAQIVVIVFQNAFDQWADASGRTDFASCLRSAVRSLREAVAQDTRP